MQRIKQNRIYLDTNICRDCIKKSRTDASINLMKTIRDKKLPCFTSIFTAMELTWIEKEEIFFHKKVRLGWEINQILRNRFQQDLTQDNLKEAEDRIKAFWKEYDFIEFTNLDNEGWDLALKYISQSNLPSADIIHIVSAWQANCNFLITSDSFLIKEGTKILEKEKVTNKLKICTTSEFEKFIKSRTKNK